MMTRLRFLPPFLPSRFGMGLTVLAAGLAVGVSASPAGAQTFCSEPLVPSCVDLSSTGRDSPGIQRCEQEVEQYAMEVTTYLGCISQKTQDLRKSVTDARRKIEQMRTQNQLDRQRDEQQKEQQTPPGQ